MMVGAYSVDVATQGQQGDTMHDDYNAPTILEMDAREYEREPEISDEDFCRSVQWFFEGVPPEDDR